MDNNKMFIDIKYCWLELKKVAEETVKTKFKKVNFNILCKNLNVYYKNNYYKNIYINAPTILCKAYIATLLCIGYDNFVYQGKYTVLQDNCKYIVFIALYLFNEEECKYVRDHLSDSSNIKTFFNKFIKYIKNNNSESKEMDFSDFYIEIWNPFYKDENYNGWFPNSDIKYATCPKCGQILDFQKGFKETNKIHICTNCGLPVFNPLFDDKIKIKNILWICDNCGDYMNNQEDFTDWDGVWKCKKCGYLNDVTENNIK